MYTAWERGYDYLYKIFMHLVSCTVTMVGRSACGWYVSKMEITAECSIALGVLCGGDRRCGGGGNPRAREV